MHISTIDRFNQETAPEKVADTIETDKEAKNESASSSTEKVKAMNRKNRQHSMTCGQVALFSLSASLFYRVSRKKASPFDMYINFDGPKFQIHNPRTQ